MNPDSSGDLAGSIEDSAVIAWASDQLLAAQVEKLRYAAELERTQLELEKARAEIERLTPQAARADRAERIICNVRALATQWAVLRTYGSASTELKNVIDAGDI